MENNHSHSINNKTYIGIWVGLLILTTLSVEASFVHFRTFAMGVALFIATAKAFIVGYYFMHLKFDSKIIGIMILVTGVVFLTFIILTFFDYAFREPII